MKTILAKTIFIIYCIFFLTNQLISQTQPFLSFQENLNLPQNNLGVMPECIVEVNDVIDEIPIHKLYVYGMQGILIYDLNSSNCWLSPDKLEFTEQPDQPFGFYDRSLLIDLLNYPARQPMIYIPEEKGFGQLFAVGPDLRLWCINVVNDQPAHILTSSHLSGFSLISSKLVFDPINTRILWLVYAKSVNSENYVCSFLPVSLINYTIGIPLNTTGTITDFAINDDATKNIMYLGLTIDETHRYWVLRELDDFGPIASYQLNFFPGLIKYVHTQDMHQVYCLPDCKNTQQAAIYVLNGDSPSHSYLTIESPVPGYMCAAFNDSKNHLFLGAYTDYAEPIFNDVFIYQCQNNLAPTPLCTLNTNGYSGEKQNLPFSIEPVNGNENLIMKRHEIVKLTYNEGSQCHYYFQQLLPAFGNCFGSADPTVDSRIFITNMTGGGFLEYNTSNNPWTLTNHQTGQAVHSCFTSEGSGKNYYFSKKPAASSHIFIDEDFTLGSFTDYSYPNPIGDCIYNPFQHHILISDYLRSPNANLNAYAEVQGGLSFVDNITINETHSGEMFITNDGKLLYFSGGNNVNPKINICSALNYDLQLGQINLTKSEFSASDQLEVLFAGQPYQNYFVVSDVFDPEGGQPLQPTSLMSYFYVLDPDDLSESPSVEIHHDSPRFLEVLDIKDPNRSEPDGYAFIAGSESYFSEIFIDALTLEMTVNQRFVSSVISAMKLARYNNDTGPISELYIATWEQGEISSKLYKHIPGSEENPQQVAELSDCFISSMNYNPQTALLYCYGIENGSSVVYQFDVMNQYAVETQGLKLKRISSDNIGTNLMIKTNDLLFDNENHQVFIPNGDHSSISRLGFAFDRIHIKDKVSWLSFPRLENEDFSAQTLLEGIRPFPSYIQMTNLPLQEEIPELVVKTYTNNSWYGELNNVKSTFGYKLSTDNQYVSYVPMLGSILNSSTNITIYPGHENWVGYFPTWPQDPFDALADILDELTLIKHHDWVCVKEWGYIRGNLEPYWICSITTPLKYADMLILECSENVTFQWGEEFSAEKRELPEPDHFLYSEKPDYTPIFIELDTNDQALEIGAFVADSCIGATVVEAGDSSVMLRGYMPNDTSGIITFEKYYGSEKRSSDRISEYYVQNSITRVREKRAIDSREKSKYYRVSFKNENKSSYFTNPLILNFNPNPCQGYCAIEYFLPDESDVTFSVFDVYGREINNLLLENGQAGNYSISWPKLVPGGSSPGIYMIRMSACGNIIAKKVIITK